MWIESKQEQKDSDGQIASEPVARHHWTGIFFFFDFQTGLNSDYSVSLKECN
jgi:hypothetical protein